MSRKNNAGRIVSAPFHMVSSNTLSNTLATVTLSPATMSTRMGLIANNYALYRVKSLKFRIHPGSVSGTVAAAYLAGIVDDLPTAYGQLVEAVSSTMIAGNVTTVPTEWITVSPKELAGPFNWYKTVVGTTDASEEYPGALYIYGSGVSQLVLVEIRGTYEYKEAISASNTPALVALANKTREERTRASNERDRIALMKTMGLSQVMIPTTSQSLLQGGNK